MCDLDLDFADLLRAEQSPVVFSLCAGGFVLSVTTFRDGKSIVHLTRSNQLKHHVLRCPRISILEPGET